MQSIFRYPGGKTRKRVREWVLKHSPPDSKEYREPFVGGGGIFFGISPFENRWINDKDEHLISVYQALKDKPDDLIAKCQSVAPYKKRSGDEQEYDRLEKEFNRIAFDDNEDKAFRFLFLNRTVWGGRVNYQYKSRVYFSNPKGWTDDIIDRLHQAKKYLKNAKITCGDYEQLLSEPGDSVWIYCDPPYVKPFKGTSSLYRHDFNDEDHARFAEAVRRSNHKIAISYEDDQKGVVRSLYRGFDILETEILARIAGDGAGIGTIVHHCPLAPVQPPRRRQAQQRSCMPTKPIRAG